MKGIVRAFAPNGNSFTGSDGNEVYEQSITVETDGAQITFPTFARKANIGEEIEYELYNDKQGNRKLRILRPEKTSGYGKGGGRDSSAEIDGRARNQAAQLAMQWCIASLNNDGMAALDSFTNTADRVYGWLRNPTGTQQKPAAQYQAGNTPDQLDNQMDEQINK